MTVLVEECRECWSEGYWLRHCTGYRVEGPEGHVGYVEEVLLDPEGRALRALVVHGTRKTTVSLGEIAQLLPAQELVLVGATRVPHAPTPLAKAER